MTDTGQQLIIRLRWWQWTALFLIFFCIAWDSFLVFWYSMAFGAPMHGAGGVRWIMVVFPIAHVAVGVGLTYFALTMLVNRTIVTVDITHLSVRHGPLPWAGNRDLVTADIAQFFCKEKMAQGKNGASCTYSVQVRLRDGTARQLLSGIGDEDDALFIEQALERWLGLKDEPVAGEVSR